MNKQIDKLKAEKEKLQRQITALSQTMIRGSLVKIARRCHNKSCSCYNGSKKHGYLYCISIPGESRTQMFYLQKDLARSKKLSSSLRSFKQFWKLSKKLAQINLILYKKGG